MSRVYQKPIASTTRRPPAARSPQRTVPPTSTTNRSITRGARAPIRGRTMHTQPPRREQLDNHPYDDDDDRTNQQERAVHIGDGYHMFTPSTTKREQMRRQADNETRQYEAHIERTRLHNIHEVHRLGGDELTVDEVRQRQAEKYRREKFERLEKTHQDQFQKKQEEEKDIEARKQAARQQSIENQKRARDTQLNLMKPKVNQSNQGATGWTAETREEDRRETMDRFLNKFTQQYDDMNISSDEKQKKNHNNKSKSEKLAILRELLPDIDDQTLEYHLEIYNGNIDAIVQEFLN